MNRGQIHVNLLWCAAGRVGGSEEYLVRQLLVLPDGIRAVVHLGRALAESRPELHRHELVIAGIDVDRRAPRIVAEHTALAASTRAASLVHHGGGTMPVVRPSAPTVLTVHDLQYRRFPQYFSRGRRTYLQQMMPRSVRAATIITTPTAHVADDVAESFGVDRQRILIVPHGVSPSDAGPADIARVRQTHLGGGEGRLLLYPAITHPHKGHRLLIDAFSRWSEPDDRLVLIGGVGHAESEVMSAVQRLGLADRVTRLGRVPALERDALIAASDLVVVPSEEEGFGAPVLEAMAAGTPVVASRIGALAEVVGDAGVLVERDVDALVDAIRLVLSDPEPWSVRGRDRAREFTIEISGSALHDAYREAIDRGSR